MFPVFPVYGGGEHSGEPGKTGSEKRGGEPSGENGDQKWLLPPDGGEIPPPRGNPSSYQIPFSAQYAKKKRKKSTLFTEQK